MPRPNPDYKPQESSLFELELAELLNKYNLDTVCDTPDFILAANIIGHLAETTKLVRSRDKFLGRESANKQISNRGRKVPKT